MRDNFDMVGLSREISWTRGIFISEHLHRSRSMLASGIWCLNKRNCFCWQPTFNILHFGLMKKVFLSRSALWHSNFTSLALGSWDKETHLHWILFLAPLLNIHMRDVHFKLPCRVIGQFKAIDLIGKQSMVIRHWHVNWCTHLFWRYLWLVGKVIRRLILIMWCRCWYWWCCFRCSVTVLNWNGGCRYG